MTAARRFGNLASLAKTARDTDLTIGYERHGPIVGRKVVVEIGPEVHVQPILIRAYEPVRRPESRGQESPPEEFSHDDEHRRDL